MLPLSKNASKTQWSLAEKQLVSGGANDAFKTLKQIYQQNLNDQQIVARMLQIASRAWDFELTEHAILSLVKLSKSSAKNWALITMSVNLFCETNLVSQVKKQLKTSSIGAKEKKHYLSLLGTNETGDNNPKIIQDGERARKLINIPKLQDAELICRQALARFPANKIFLESLVTILTQTGRGSAATQLLERRVDYFDDNGHIAFYLARQLFKDSRIAAALPHSLRSIEIIPQNTAFLELYARILENLDHDKEALEIVEQIEALATNHGKTELIRADIARKMGDINAYETHVRHAFAAEPNFLPAILNALNLPETSSDSDLFKKAAGQIIQSPGQDDLKLSAHFSIADIYHREKNIASAFQAYATANDASMHAIASNKSTPARVREKVIQTFDIDAIAALGALSERRETNQTPIYITGLPRSGTTLVEQIISKHSDVVAGGEIPHTTEAFKGYKALRKDGNIDITSAHQILNTASSELFAEWAGRAPNVTNKSVNQHLNFVPVTIANPDRKFIVLRRDPRDNLFSIYRSKFQGHTHPYAYSFETLVAHYVRFVETLNAIEEHFPGQIYQIQYEKLVDDLEGESRKLLDYCGLEWEPGVLEFYNNNNKVRTLSVQQVRKPIYKSSVAAWKPYEEHLQPMFDMLKEAGHLPD